MSKRVYRQTDAQTQGDIVAALNALGTSAGPFPQRGAPRQSLRFPVPETWDGTGPVPHGWSKYTAFADPATFDPPEPGDPFLPVALTVQDDLFGARGQTLPAPLRTAPARIASSQIQANTGCGLSGQAIARGSLMRSSWKAGPG